MREDERGTEVEDGRHVAGLTGGDDACGARPSETEERERERLTCGPGLGFSFSFLSFFFLGSDNLPPLRKSRPEI